MNTYEVIISRLGVPHCEVEITLDTASPARAAEAVKLSRAEDGAHEEGDTYDAVERDDEHVHYFDCAQEYAALAAIGSSPAFAAHVQEVVGLEFQLEGAAL